MAFHSMQNKDQILLKKNVAAIIMLYKDTKIKVRTQDVDTDQFDIVAGVLHGDT